MTSRSFTSQYFMSNNFIYKNKQKNPMCSTVHKLLRFQSVAFFVNEWMNEWWGLFSMSCYLKTISFLFLELKISNKPWCPQFLSIHESACARTHTPHCALLEWPLWTVHLYSQHSPCGRLNDHRCLIGLSCLTRKWSEVKLLTMVLFVSLYFSTWYTHNIIWCGYS